MKINPAITRRIYSLLRKYILLAVPPSNYQVDIDVKWDLGVLQINTHDQHHPACRGTFL
jgi:hypothetical protein